MPCLWFATEGDVPHNETKCLLHIDEERMLGPRVRFWITRAAILIFASVCFLAGERANAQIPGQESNGGSKPDRRYDKGPLGEADFKGEPPAEGELTGKPFQAFLV